MKSNNSIKSNNQAATSGLLVVEEDLRNFYIAVSRAMALGFFSGPHGPLEETAWIHVTVDQLEQMERAATASINGDGRYLPWLKTLVSQTMPWTPISDQVPEHTTIGWELVRPQQPLAVVVAGVILDRLLEEKDLVWAHRAAGFYLTRITALNRTLSAARGVLASKVSLEQLAETVREENPIVVDHEHGIVVAPVAAPVTTAHAPIHDQDNRGTKDLKSTPLEYAWRTLLEVTRRNWDEPIPTFLQHLADVLADLPAGSEDIALSLVDLANKWDEVVHDWPPLNDNEHPVHPDDTVPGQISDRNRCVPEQPQHGGKWEIAQVDATEVEEKCPPAASLDRASASIYGWAGDQLIKAQNEWTEIQLCIEKTDIGKCIREEDQSYSRCDQQEDQSYSRCDQQEDQGHNECCDWWPCSWLCDAWVWVSNIVCVARTWVENIVCVARTWVENIVCVARTWVEKVVCVAWEVLKTVGCVIEHIFLGLVHLVGGLGGILVGAGIRWAGGLVDGICKLFGVGGTTRQASILKVVGIHCAVLHTNKVLLFAFDEGVQPVSANNPADFTAIADSDRALCALWDYRSGKATYVRLRRNAFCSHHSFMADGKLFAASGQFPLPGLMKNLFPPTPLAPGADRDMHLFNPNSEQWQRLPDMQEGRWYPTCATLPDGRILIASGTNGYATSPGLGRGIRDTWQIANPVMSDVGPLLLFSDVDPKGTLPPHFYHLYPFMHVLPLEKVFVHFKRTTVLFDPVLRQIQRIARGTATNNQTGQTCHLYSRTGPGPGTSVLLPLKPRRNPNGEIEYPAGRILILGGGGAEKQPEPVDPTDSETHADGTSGYNLNSQTPATNTSEILNLEDATPEWRYTKEFMKNGRVMPDAVLLPTGKVFVVNGGRTGQSGGLLAHFTSADLGGKPDLGATDPVLEPELFDPETETWEQLCSKPLERLYHATAVLLPDARVLVAGHDGALNMQPYDASRYELEVFSPPYLFAADGRLAARPSIISAPDTIGFGQTAAVETEDAADIALVALIRQSSITHQINSDQRFIELPILETIQNKLTVQIPPNGGIAPPGFYMLFLVNRAGVPSEAVWLRIPSQ